MLGKHFTSQQNKYICPSHLNERYYSHGGWVSSRHRKFRQMTDGSGQRNHILSDSNEKTK